MSMKHACHAHCGATCKPAMLMCGPCWRLVPAGVQRLVYRYFNPDCPRGKAAPSGEWMIAAEVAVAAVRISKGLPVDPAGIIGLAIDYAHDLEENHEEGEHKPQPTVEVLRLCLEAVKPVSAGELRPLRVVLETAVHTEEETLARAARAFTREEQGQALQGPSVALPAQPRLTGRIRRKVQ